MTPILTLILVLIIALYLLRWLTTPALFLYHIAQALEEGGTRVGQGCYSQRQRCIDNLQQALQGRKMSVRLMALGVGSLIIGGDAGLLLLRVPALFHLNGGLVLPFSLEAAAGILFVFVGVLLGWLLLELTGVISDPDALLLPQLSKGKRIVWGCIILLAMVIYIASMAYIAYYSQQILDHLQTGQLDLDIVFYMAIPIGVATCFAAWCCKIGFSGIPPLWYACAAAVCGVVGFMGYVVAWLFAIPRRVIEKLNPGVLLSPELLDGYGDGGVPVPVPAPTPSPGGFLMTPTHRFMVLIDNGPTYYDLMAQTAWSAGVNFKPGSEVLAAASVDENNQAHPKLPIRKAINISPSLKQQIEAQQNAASSRSGALLTELFKAVNYNLREVKARHISPKLLVETFCELPTEQEALSQVAAFTSQIHADLGGQVQQMVIASPSIIDLRATTPQSICQAADTLHQQGKLDVCFVHTPTAPVVKRFGDVQTFHKALGVVMGVLAVGKFAKAQVCLTDILGKLKLVSPVWSVAVASTPVVPVVPWWYRILTWLLARFSTKWASYAGMQADQRDTFDQIKQVIDRVEQNDPTIRALDVPIVTTEPLIFVCLLPFHPHDPHFGRLAAAIYSDLTTRFRYAMCMFTATPGIPEAHMTGKHIATLFTLFPITQEALLSSQAAPQPIGAPQP